MKQLLYALQLLPTVLAAVKGVEDVIGAGNGKTKKDLVLSSVQAAAKAGTTSDVPAVSMIAQLVDTTVSILNASGIFKTATAVQAQ